MRIHKYTFEILKILKKQTTFIEELEATHTPLTKQFSSRQEAHPVPLSAGGGGR